MLTARTITRRLMFDRWRRSFTLPNYTPAGWWECDLFELTPSGFFVEYEVKVSRNDFLKDREKQRSLSPHVVGGDPKCQHAFGLRPAQCVRCPARLEIKTERKLDLVAIGDPRGPSRFFYVTPAGLLRLDEVPSWAGLIEIRELEKTRYPYKLAITQVQAAPRLHRKPLESTIVEHARRTCYRRMGHLLMGDWGPGEEAAEYVI